MEGLWIVLGGLALLVFIVAVAANGNNTPAESLRHPKLRDGVVVFSHNCGNITWTEKNQPRAIILSPDIKLENRGLQKKIREYITHTPLNTEIRITNYAWDLTDALELTGHLDDYWDPVGAYCFGNEVVMVRYMERPREGVKVSDKPRDLYFAADDGHLIYFRNDV